MWRRHSIQRGNTGKNTKILVENVGSQIGETDVTHYTNFVSDNMCRDQAVPYTEWNTRPAIVPVFMLSCKNYCSWVIELLFMGYPYNS